jgi:hypothetical protein
VGLSKPYSWRSKGSEAINMLEASQSALTILMFESGTPPKETGGMVLTGGDRNVLNAYLKNITMASSAIAGSANLLFKFMIDDDCGDQIPSEVKSNNIRGSLLESILVANGQIFGDVESLECRIRQVTDSDQEQGGEA